MVAHTRKTPGAGPLRPIKNGDAKPGAVKPRAVKTGAATPGAVSQSLQFRSLNLPVPIEVAEDRMERPVSVSLPPTISNRPASPSRRPAQEVGHLRLSITAISDLWQVDDEWWRERPISRRYYQIITKDDRRLTVFRDQLSGNWYWQKGV